jgi:hypothetical protein
VRLRPAERRLSTLVVYLSAAVVYVVVGVFFVDFMLSVVIAAVYLLVAAWLVPSALRRLT